MRDPKKIPKRHEDIIALINEYFNERTNDSQENEKGSVTRKRLEKAKPTVENFV